MDIKNILKEYEYGETSLIRKNKIFKKETENMLNGLSEILKYKNTHSFYYTKNDNYIIISDNGNRLLTLSKDILTQIFLDNDYFKGLSKTIVNFKIDDYVNFKKEISYIYDFYSIFLLNSENNSKKLISYLNKIQHNIDKGEIYELRYSPDSDIIIQIRHNDEIKEFQVSKNQDGIIWDLFYNSLGINFDSANIFIKNKTDLLFWINNFHKLKKRNKNIEKIIIDYFNESSDKVNLNIFYKY